MDIYAYIKRDHDRIADLMQQVVADRDPGARLRLLDRIALEVRLLLAAKDDGFYKAIAEAARLSGADDSLDHAHQAHDEIRGYLDRLITLAVEDEAWIETFGEFKHAVSHHCREEEAELWPRARKVLSSHEASQLVRRMGDIKREMQPELDIPAGVLAQASRLIGLGSLSRK